MSVNSNTIVATTLNCLDHNPRAKHFVIFCSTKNIKKSTQIIIE